MNNTNIKEKPCVVPAKQGFSVSYNQRFLYSKYNPSKLIIDKVSELSILPGTIFLCNSAILEYGIKELCNKLPENCLIYTDHLVVRASLVAQWERVLPAKAGDTGLIPDPGPSHGRQSN